MCVLELLRLPKEGVPVPMLTLGEDLCGAKRLDTEMSRRGLFQPLNISSRVFSGAFYGLLHSHYCKIKVKRGYQVSVWGR